MDATHRRLRALVLQVEDLEGSALEAATDHMASCTDCRRLLDQLREKEGMVRAGPGIPEDGAAALAALAPEDRREAEVSRELLLEKLVAPHRPRRRMRTGMFLATALSAAAVLALLFLRPDSEPSLQEIMLVPAETTRAGEAANGWRAGDVVALRLISTQATHVFVVMVDENGAASVLVPSFATTAGQEIRLPHDGQDGWRIGPAGATLQLFVCETASADLDVDGLLGSTEAGFPVEAMRAAGVEWKTLEVPIQ